MADNPDSIWLSLGRIADSIKVNETKKNEVLPPIDGTCIYNTRFLQVYKTSDGSRIYESSDGSIRITESPDGSVRKFETPGNRAKIFVDGYARNPGDFDQFPNPCSCISADGNIKALESDDRIFFSNSVFASSAIYGKPYTVPRFPTRKAKQNWIKYIQNALDRYSTEIPPEDKIVKQYLKFIQELLKEGVPFDASEHYERQGSGMGEIDREFLEIGTPNLSLKLYTEVGYPPEPHFVNALDFVIKDECALGHYRMERDYVGKPGKAGWYSGKPHSVDLDLLQKNLYQWKQQMKVLQ